MSTRHPSSTFTGRAGFTFVEALASIAVIGVVAAATLPILTTVTDNYAQAQSLRRSTESASFAMERSMRLLRDIPAGATAGTLGITSASATSITLSDGRSLALSGSTLTLTASPGQADTLLSNVEAFSLSFLAEDGLTSVVGAPSTAWCIHIEVQTGGLNLRSAVFPRVRMTP